MDKIAIISDVHGNLEALRTVLEDIQRRGVQRIFCLGDTLSKGTHQQECVDLVRRSCEVVLQGNHDECCVRPLGEMGDYDREHAQWVQSKLSEETKEYVRKLPFCYEFYLSGRLVRLLHAHPQTNDKAIGNIDKLEHYYELFLPSERTISGRKADIVVYGHIHTAFAQKIYNRLILNPGSVGNAVSGLRNPEKDADARFMTVASYLILTGEMGERVDADEKSAPENEARKVGKLTYEFVDLPYDIEKELAANQDNVDFEAYAREMREGRYRAMDKMYRMYEGWGIETGKI